MKKSEEILLPHELAPAPTARELDMSAGSVAPSIYSLDSSSAGDGAVPSTREDDALTLTASVGLESLPVKAAFGSVGKP